MQKYKDVNKVDEEDKTSRMNSAGLINSTLENLWHECYNAMGRGDYLLWNIKLDAIWSILGGDCKDGDVDDLLMTKINSKIYEAGSFKSKVGTGFGEKINPNNAIQYLWLLNKNLFLRRLQNKQGKGTAYQRDDEDDFD